MNNQTISKIFVLILSILVFVACNNNTPSANTNNKNTYKDTTTTINSSSPNNSTTTPPEKTSIPNKTQELESVIIDILQHTEDINYLNDKYIHPKFGLYNVYRMGVPDRFEVLKKIEKKNPEEIGHSTPYGSLMGKIETIPTPENLNVTYDCDEEEGGWSKEGLFYTKKIKYPSINKIITQEIEYEEAQYNSEDIKKAEYLEKNSIRVVLTSSELIFYVTKIDDRWYITLIDNVTTDCSA